MSGTNMFAGLCDDAAVFPPGDVPLKRAVPAHVEHEAAAHASIVGPFVLAAKNLRELASLVADLRTGSFRLTVTVSAPEVESALAAAALMPAVRLCAIEVGVPDGVPGSAVVAMLDRALAGHQLPVFVELPRDGRRAPLVAELAGTRYQAKLRTGGVRADLYPDETELAAAVVALIAAAVPFKATAGLHRAIRNTDPATGFEQHGFLNVMIAAQAAADGADVTDVTGLLSERAPARVLAAAWQLNSAVRQWFSSFGTCSITEPVEDLVALGLLPRDYLARVLA
jgi:hypothetical protein